MSADGDPPTTEWRARPLSPGPGTDSGTPSTGRFVRADPPRADEPATTTGWVVAGAASPAKESAGAAETERPPTAAPAPRSSWPESAVRAWAATPAPAAPAPAPRLDRRRWGLLGALAAGALIVALAAAAGGGFLVGARSHPRVTPRPAPPLRTTTGPLGSVDAGFVSFTLATGWLEQQQSDDDVRIDHFPTGRMEIAVQSRAAATTPQSVLLQTEQGIVRASTTTGLVTACMAPTTHVIAGLSGVEQGFQWQERAPDGKTLVTNCEVEWVSVQDGKVYVWDTLDTLAGLKATNAAATRMQRTAHWRE